MVNLTLKKDIVSIADSKVTQWDYGQELKLDGNIDFTNCEVHFSTYRSNEALIVKATSDIVSIPDAILATMCAEKISVYVYVKTESSGTTIYEGIIYCNMRSKPDDYPQEMWESINEWHHITKEVPRLSKEVSQLSEEVKYEALLTLSTSLLDSSSTGQINSQFVVRNTFKNNEVKFDNSNKGSLMVWIPKFRLCDVLSTSDTSVHPAFIVNDVEIDGFYIGKYQSIHIDNKAYSVPLKDPTSSSKLDTFVACAKANGDNWHEVTNAEWAAVALWCHKNGFEPCGNNNYGKDTSESLYKAIPSSGRDNSGKIQRVATGTGPVTWSHDGTVEGIWDMNGNVWEWCTGLRLVYGEVQIIADNNAVDPTANLSASSNQWKAIKASDGSLITPDGNGTTTGSVKLDYIGGKWTYSTNITSFSDSSRSCKFTNVTCDDSISAVTKLLLQSLALLPDTALTGNGIDATYGGDNMWVNNAQAERCSSRGGGWGNGASVGVFGLNLNYPRSFVGPNVGGRSALIE